MAGSHKDSRLTAVIAMNIFCLCGVGQSTFYKLASAQGFKVIDYQFLRSLTIFSIAVTEMALRRKRPNDKSIADRKTLVFFRSFTGQLCFFLFNLCLSLIPLSFTQIIFQTSSFWTSILACCVFAEPLYFVEMVGMVICFAGMVTITLSGQSGADPAVVESAGAGST